MPPASSSPPPAPDASLPAEPMPAERSPRGTLPRYGRVNLLLILGSVVVTLISSLGENQESLSPLFISLFWTDSPNCLIEVRHGELWRLFTPMFIHFGIAHLGINMLGLKNVGDAMEYVHGSRFYLFLTAALALCSNLGQYFISGSWRFGGMSGVLYGLFGYLWLRGLSDPAYPLRMTRQTIIISMVWFGACFSGFMPIANGAHTTGLVVGAGWGLVAGWRAKLRLAQ